MVETYNIGDVVKLIMAYGQFKDQIGTITSINHWDDGEEEWDDDAEMDIYIPRWITEYEVLFHEPVKVPYDSTPVTRGWFEGHHMEYFMDVKIVEPAEDIYNDLI